METRKPTKRQAQAAATREQLLIAAATVFAERGYQATTVGAITSQANTAHGTFYLYFKNKEDVFATVIDSVMLRFHDLNWTIEPGMSPRDAIEAALRGALEVYREQAGIWRCLLEATFTTPSVEATRRQVREGFINRFGRVLAELGDAGVIRELDPWRTASALGGMIEWTATELVMRVDEIDESWLDQTVSTMAELWYHALFADVPAERPLA